MVMNVITSYNKMNTNISAPEGIQT